MSSLSELPTRARPSELPMLSQVAAQYDARRELPLGGYATLATIFGVALGSVVVCAKPRQMRLDTADLALFSVSTFQLARIISKDRVLAPLRAPFTSFRASSGAGEIEDTPRGRGVRRAIGELLTCPYCLAPWVAGAHAVAALVAPRRARWVAGIFAVVAVADLLQQGYAALREAA